MMRRILVTIQIVTLVALCDAPTAHSAEATFLADNSDNPRVRHKRKRGAKKDAAAGDAKPTRRGRGTRGASGTDSGSKQGFDRAAPASRAAPAVKANKPLESLDLSNPPPPGADDKARQEIIGPASSGKSGKDAIDFGGEYKDKGAAGKGSDINFDFGGEQASFDLGATGLDSPQRKRFESAMSLMSDEDYGSAALEFSYILQDKAFAAFHPESQYQLGKALYRSGFYEAALSSYLKILEQGAKHARYKKSVEWLFFISRKLEDQTPVMAQLAHYRNVTFPKAYRSEYNYLLAKYLFMQANDFEMKRLHEAEVAQGKSQKENQIDFGAVADSIDSGKAAQAAAALDFGAPAPAGGLDFGAPSGGDIDFGGGGSKPAPSKSVAPPTNAQEAVRQGLELAEQVESDSQFYARAKYLIGLLRYFSGEDQKAVEAFQEVVRLLNPKDVASPDPALRELAFLSLARIHYGYKQFDRSVYYYELIDRDSDNWLTSLFEASWAYYRRGDFEKALGNLMTLHAPFFEREYFPESKIVKAIIYFEACRYPETRTIIDGFIKEYTALLKAVEAIAQSNEAPETLLAKIAERQGPQDKQGQDDVTTRVINLTLSNPEIQQARANLKQVQEQRKHLGRMDDKFKQSDLGANLSHELGIAQSLRAKEAGDIARSKFEREMYNLKSLLAQSLRIKIEVARAERESLEKQMQGQETDDGIMQAEQRSTVDDEHLFWPYEDEYWRDELGTYEFDFSMCKQLENAAAGSGQATRTPGE